MLLALQTLYQKFYLKKYLRLALLWVGIFLFSAPLLASQPLKSSAELANVSVQLSWNHQFQFAGLYAAEKQGYYRDEGLQVEIKDWQEGINPIEEVSKGRVDFGVSYGGMVNEILKGAPLRLVMAFYQYSPLVLISHTPINDLSELADKKIMFYDNIQIRGMIKKAPLEVQESIVYIKPSGNLQDFVSGQVDLYGAYLTNEPFQLEKLNKEYYVVDPKQFGIQSYGDLLFTSLANSNIRPEMVSSFRNATIKGWQYAQQNPEEIVDYIMQNYPVKKTKEALLAEAMASIKYIMAGKMPIGHISEAKLLATVSDAHELGMISDEEFNSFDLKEVLFQPEVVFTAEEKAYLASKPVVRLANDNLWLPFEAIDDNGDYIGIVPKVLELIGERTGIEFIPQKEFLWKEVTEKISLGELDMYSCAVATPERQEYALFTEPYLSFPNVLVAWKNSPFIDDYNSLLGKKIAVVKGYWSEELFRTQYPDIELVMVTTVEEGLEKVLNSSVYAYSGNLASINFYARKKGLDGVHIIGKNEARFELAVGVHNSHPLLFSIIDKTLKEIKSSAEFIKLRSELVQVSAKDSVSIEQFIQEMKWYFVVFVLINLLFLLWFWYRRREQLLLSQIHQKEKQALQISSRVIAKELSIQKELQKRLEEFFAMVVHEIRTPVAMIDSSIQTLKLIPSDRDDLIVQRYEVIQSGANRINMLIDRYLNKQQFDSQTIEFNPAWVDIAFFVDEIARYYPQSLVETQISSSTQNDKQWFDSELMRFALINLLDNAVKYGGEGQQIYLLVQLHPTTIIFTVINGGSTIDLVEIDRLFEPFSRGNNQGDISGTGLGLYFVEQIANLHQGCFCCSNFTVDSGSVFKIIIPRDELRNELRDKP